MTQTTHFTSPPATKTGGQQQEVSSGWRRPQQEVDGGLTLVTRADGERVASVIRLLSSENFTTTKPAMAAENQLPNENSISKTNPIFAWPRYAPSSVKIRSFY
ncbi:FCD domain protein [Striga asiatica]|uniref:FCD domain protein n=1 Tax=Striga asiatica TaxID=4170 RepID=A0A5A7QQ45_STRAF|nr:FCD domain protein [Striga asiatica]